jgi:hypothetical protein
MYRLLQYYSSYARVRQGFGGMPGWARGVLLIAALPGLILVGLSILLLLVSILALLVVTVPLYRLLSWLTTDETPGEQHHERTEQPQPWSGGGPRKHVDVRIVE